MNRTGGQETHNICGKLSSRPFGDQLAVTDELHRDRFPRWPISRKGDEANKTKKRGCVDKKATAGRRVHVFGGRLTLCFRSRKAARSLLEITNPTLTARRPKTKI